MHNNEWKQYKIRAYTRKSTRDHLSKEIFISLLTILWIIRAKYPIINTFKCKEKCCQWKVFDEIDTVALSKAEYAIVSDN